MKVPKSSLFALLTAIKIVQGNESKSAKNIEKALQSEQIFPEVDLASIIDGIKDAGYCLDKNLASNEYRSNRSFRRNLQMAILKINLTGDSIKDYSRVAIRPPDYS